MSQWTGTTCRLNRTPLRSRAVAVALTLGSLAATSLPAASEWSWQQPHAKVLPTGDLGWAPEPFVFAKGESLRYIDFAGGDDANDGASQAKPWKHHPWDPQATGAAKACRGIHTYIFKHGVIYRGRLIGTESGAPGNPIRLTSDPSWGSGEAMFYGSESVANWQKGGHAQTPDADKVWHADLTFAPRLVCVVAQDGKTTRLTLARTPNWEVTDPDNVLSNCWAWENPQWWLNGNEGYKTTVNGKKMMLGVDTQHLTREADYYEGALVWSEWGIVMCAPYAAPVEAFDPVRKSIAFQGPWHDAGNNLATGHRYWLEDKPHYLDVPGEFWFEKKGEGGTLFVRLPGDADPSTVTVEAARHATLVDCKDVSHVELSGLSFRFGNICWNLDYRFFQGDVETAAVRFMGSGNDLAVHHCRFAYLSKAVRVQTAAAATARIEDVRVTDNDIAYADHGAITLSDGGGYAQREAPGGLDRVQVLRNRVREVGFRPTRPNGHFAVHVLYPETAEIAGNIIERCGAAGIFVEGGKSFAAQYDAPFTRILIHHNKVVDSLLMANDWGGIESNQGGPFYVYDNVSGNPVGMMHWNGKAFGHAYYVDGGFKAYHFNNIAWGKRNDPAALLLANCSAFQEIHSYQNTFFNNSACGFLLGTRRQAPQAGRDKFLGNVFEDISQMVFRHSDAEGKDPNARDAGKQVEHFDYQYDAYSRNALARVPGKVGVFEAEGGDYADLPAFAKALAARKALVSDAGVVSTDALVRNAAQHDFRLAPGSAATGLGVKVFVPWSLYGTVGEWNFTQNQVDPTEVIDEHWYLKPHMNDREKYYQSPMYALRAVNVTAADYGVGPLEDWANGALRLNGKDQYLVLKSVPPPTPPNLQMRAVTGTWFTATAPAVCASDVPFDLTVTLRDAPADCLLVADINCLKGNSFGGGLGTAGRQKIEGPGPYRFRVTPPSVPGVTKYLFTLYAAPGGSWDKAVQRANIEAERADAPVAFDPQIDRSGFLVEAYFQTAPGAKGVFVEKMGTAGYSLTLTAAGTAEFAVQVGDERHAIATTARLDDGKWHHLIAESDRRSKMLTLYVDGKRDASGAGVGDVSLASAADLYVGGTPSGRQLACTLEFLRLSRGSLVDAQTTIEELYAWQFDGPFLRDFQGVKPSGKRDAGALQSNGR